MVIVPVEELNEKISENAKYFIESAEMEYRRRLACVAEKIIENYEETPIVLIAGPSGSGKTTSAMRIERMLNEMGYKTYSISMDNYFLPTDDPRNERNADGSLDLESPARLDRELLSVHLRKFIECRPVEMPMFDFASQTRRFGGTLRREQGSVIIVEGIHALNPDITGIADGYSMKVYVSVRTRLQSGEELLHPSKIRLMRRLMRDKLFRGLKIPEIMSRYSLVEAGEQRYIMPYKERASFDIDTFISYEANVYKRFLLPDLADISASYEEYPRFSVIERFLEELEDVPEAYVPFDSLVREFIGGSHFNY